MMPTAEWHDVAKVHLLEFGKLPHAMAYGKKMRSYNQEIKGLSKCYWAFLDDIESGLPK
jgi:hypothetical protein